MHVLVTDSGVGGLSVVAYAERRVRERGASEPVRLTFANAAPANDFGYNAMGSRAEKLETFDRFLRSVTARFAPDAIYVACNTLSVLLPETPFAAAPPVPVRGIVETASELLLRELEGRPESVAVIFGTPTTIDAGTYPRMLVERGIDRSRIVAQACPGLADVISEDREGTRTAAAIGRCVDDALRNVAGTTENAVALLACTHYGYRKDLFSAAFAARGISATVIDPNERAAGDLFPPAFAGPNHESEVAFVTRYAIPAPTIDALSYFLAPISPRTVEAMRSFDQIPGLF